MSITANLVRQINFPGVQNICLYRFDIPSIPASTIEPDIKFLLNGPGKFENIRVACLSPNYSFSIKYEPAVPDLTIEDLYRVINIDKYDFDDQADIWWGKPAGPNENCLYGEINNCSGVATGVVTFEFVLVCF